MNLIHILHQARVIPKYALVQFQAQINYRLGAMIWIVNGLIGPLVLMGVWITSSQSQNLDYTQNQIITYYIMSILIVRLTQSWAAESIGERIHAGVFSVYLVKPFSIVSIRLAADLSLKMIRMITLIPIFAFLVFIFRSSFSIAPTPANIFFFSIAVILGYALNFIVEVALGFSAFWLEQSNGVYGIYGVFNSFLNGTLIPIALMPHVFINSIKLMPFRYIVSFPIEIITGTLSQAQIGTGFTILFVWLILAYTSLSLVYKQGVKKYSAVGN